MTINEWFKEGHIVDEEYLNKYKKHYENKKDLLISLSTSKNTISSDFYNNDIFNYTWQEFFNKILNEDYHGENAIIDRIKVLTSAKKLFKRDRLRLQVVFGGLIKRTFKMKLKKKFGNVGQHF